MLYFGLFPRQGFKKICYLDDFRFGKIYPELSRPHEPSREPSEVNQAQGALRHQVFQLRRKDNNLTHPHSRHYGSPRSLFP